MLENSSFRPKFDFFFSAVENFNFILHNSDEKILDNFHKQSRKPFSIGHRGIEINDKLNLAGEIAKT